MSKNEIKCCLYCGRDTSAIYQVCVRCFTGKKPQNFAQINDTKDRPVLSKEYDERA